MSFNEPSDSQDNNTGDCSYSKLEKRPKLNTDANHDDHQNVQRKIHITNNMRSTAFRKFHKIPIYIVEYHNDVLEFIYKCFASRHLPIYNNIMIHFDSHPDMVISRELKSSTVYNKNELFEQLSIENWIMPGCYAGHFKNLIWIKNSWCKQIPATTSHKNNYKFKIGEFNDGGICVSLPIDYFISEGNYCEEDKLKNSKEITLNVIDCDLTQSIQLPESTSSSNSLTSSLLELNEDHENNIILDIDLDFFSTQNPFLNIYEKINCYKKLKEIFSYSKKYLLNADDNKDNDCNEDSNDNKISKESLLIYENVCKKRRSQLNYLDEIFNYLQLNRNLKNYHNPDYVKVPKEIYEKIQNLVNEITAEYDDKDIDWNLIKDAGYTCDDDDDDDDNNGLPHHYSTEDELKLYFDNFENLLKNLKKLPTIITISRSSEDDYCPKNQVDMIQQKVIEILQRIYENKITDKPILAYNEDEWDIMKL